MDAKSGAVEMTAGAKGLHVNLKHGPSGAGITTDAPRDNGGQGSSFSPTDLLCASFASCALTTMALVAQRENIPWGEASARFEKHMNAAPRKVAKIVCELMMPGEVPPEHRERMERVAHECPVARSLSPEVKLEVSFRWR